MRRASPAWLIPLAMLAACSDGGGRDEVAGGPGSSLADQPTSSVAVVGTSVPAGDATAPSRAPVSSAAPTTEGGAAPSEVAPLDWSECPRQVALAQVAECATLVVPLDHQRPDGATIDIAVSRYDTADDADQIGSLVINPGGPGASGVDYLPAALLSIPAAVQERFDLVGFDPRGVGASSAVECDLPTDDDVTLLRAGDDAGWESLVDRAEAFTASCTAASLDLLEWVGTNAAARDLDLLRAALGDGELTYLGYSYGTRLGATYAELFPQRVRAMVLDGAVKPTTDRAATLPEQAGGFDRAFEHFAAACDADADCLLTELGPTIDVVAGLRDELAGAGSFPTDDPARVLTAGEFDLALVAALYSEGVWPYLAQGLYVAEVDQDGSILQALADSYVGRRPDGTNEGVLAANRVISCADEPQRRSADEERAIADGAAEATEHFADFIRASTGCLGIPAARDPLVIGPAAAAPPLLVVGNTGDPATPYEWAVELTDSLVTAVLYTVEAEGHTAYGTVGCVADTVDAYLIELTVPAEDGSCADVADRDVFLPVGESQFDQVIAFLDCLRDEGVDLPEIDAADLIADPAGETIERYLDPSDPEFVAATLACQDVIPRL